MSDFTVKQGDTINIDYVIPGVDLSLKKVYFCFGDKFAYSKKVECKRQAFTSKKYAPLCSGGLTIPFKGADLDRPGLFRAEFEIFSRNGDKITYPQINYLMISVLKSI